MNIKFSYKTSYYLTNGSKIRQNLLVTYIKLAKQVNWFCNKLLRAKTLKKHFKRNCKFSIQIFIKILSRLYVELM